MPIHMSVPLPSIIKERHPEQKPHCAPRVAYEGHTAPKHRGNSSHSNPNEVLRGAPEIKQFALLVFNRKNTTPEVSAGHVYLRIGNIIVTQVEFSNCLSMIFNLSLPQE